MGGRRGIGRNHTPAAVGGMGARDIAIANHSQLGCKRLHCCSDCTFSTFCAAENAKCLKTNKITFNIIRIIGHIALNGQSSPRSRRLTAGNAGAKSPPCDPGGGAFAQADDTDRITLTPEKKKFTSSNLGCRAACCIVRGYEKKRIGGFDL